MKTLDGGMRAWRQATWAVFGLALILALCLFGPALIADGGRLTLFADFDRQEIAFNVHSIARVQSARWGWDPSIDLGSSFIGAFGFYTLGSPFFWLSALAPAALLPCLIGWLYMAKYVAAALSAFVFAKRYVNRPQTAVLAALLYAFSGFNTINLIFYHFHDVVAFFPLLLAAVDRLIDDQKRGRLAVIVALMAFLNHFFFVGEVVFVLLYVAVTKAPDLWRSRRLARTLALCMVEGVIGVCLASVLLLPSLLITLRNPRATPLMMSWSALIYDPARYGRIARALLLPAGEMAHQAAFGAYDFSSSAAYLPLVGVAMLWPSTPAWPRRWGRLSLILLIVALVPVLNQSFVGFTGQYYARWFYMPLLLLAVVSARRMATASWHEMAKGAGASVILIGLVLVYAVWGARRHPSLWPIDGPRLAVFVAVAVFGLIVTVILARLPVARRFGVRMALFIVAVAVASALTGAMGVTLARRHREVAEPYDQPHLAQGLIDRGEGARLSPAPGQRLMVNRQTTNLTVHLDLPSVNSFISTIAPPLFRFYDAIGAPRYVSTDISHHDDALLSALSVTRILCHRHGAQTTPAMHPAFRHTRAITVGRETLDVYDQPYATTIGFTHRYFMPQSAFMRLDRAARHRALVKALIVSDDDVKRVCDRLTELPPDVWARPWQDDARARQASSPRTIVYNNRGVRATYDVAQPTVAWFSVPHEEGFSAWVNGREVPILDSLGLMAIAIPKGHVEVELVYETPGLRAGLILTAVGGVSLGLWLLRSRRLSRGR